LISPRGVPTSTGQIVRAAENGSLLRAWNAPGIGVMTILAMASSDIPLGDAAESRPPTLEALEAGDVTPERSEALAVGLGACWARPEPRVFRQRVVPGYVVVLSRAARACWWCIALRGSNL
jgi:hypothetical protein